MRFDELALDEIVQGKLQDILRVKCAEVEAAKERLPLAELKGRVSGYRSERSFRDALCSTAKKPSLIAELKHRSPTRGVIRPRFDPISLAQTMEGAGAAAISVLTDQQFFGGDLEYLRSVKQFTEIPILRKDFIIDPYQIYESALYGADAILLIVRVMKPDMLKELLQLAHSLGIEPLVEIHSVGDLEIARDAGAEVIGINNRDLVTFNADTNVSEQLVPKIPKGKVIVAHSGIQTSDHVLQMKRLGVHAVLIGEALMSAPDPASKINELFASAWQ